MINYDGLDIIKRFEGLVDGDPTTPGLDPYMCPADVLTIGWGSTRGLNGESVSRNHRPITESEAHYLLMRDILEAEQYVLKLVKVFLNLNEYSALVSFVYNVGPTNFRQSTLLRLLNGGDRVAASEEFWKWRRGGGEILPGLVRRREAERLLFLLRDPFDRYI
jgi:lysozyme